MSHTGFFAERTRGQAAAVTIPAGYRLPVSAGVARELELVFHFVGRVFDRIPDLFTSFLEGTFLFAAGQDCQSGASQYNEQAGF
jgi:hypothetical protein